MNILLIYGGKSAEHDISIITGCLARGYILPAHTVTVCYFDQSNNAFLVDKVLTPLEHKQKKFKTRLVFGTGDGCVYHLKGKRLSKKIKIDVALNCCHGLNGEDGAVAGLLQLSGIANCQSGLSGSAVAIDKILTKHIAKALRVPVLKAVEVDRKDEIGESLKKIQKQLKFPVILKPATLGSSIGIAVAHDEQQLETSLNTAFAFDNRVLAESALSDFFELNCSAMKAKGEILTSKIEKPVPSSEILSFADKYLSSGQKGFCPKSQEEIEVGQEYFEKVREITTLLYKSLNLNGVIRIDFLVDKRENKLYLNEINTIPGSLAYGMWSDKFSKTEFGEILIENGLEAFFRQQQLDFRFSSNVLEQTQLAKK